MKRKMTAGLASQAIPVFIQDSSSTTGAGLGSIVYNTSGLTAKYRRQGQSGETTITLATMTLGTWASGGFVTDGGGVTGDYELGLPDAAIASAAGVTWVIVKLYGVTNMLACQIEIELDQVDYQTTAFGALKPATPGRTAVVDANGLMDANTVKVGPTGTGTAQTARDIGTSVLLSSGTGTGQILLSSGKVVTPDDQKVDVNTIKTNAVVNAGTVTFPANSTLSSSAEVTAIQNNTRTVIVVPTVIERPDSGTETYKIHIYLYDENGNMEAPDSAPVAALANSAGTDRSGRLGSTTGTLVNTGHYSWTYTNTSTDTLEQLLWEFTIVEGGATRLYGRDSLLVDTTSVDFTSADRTTLGLVATAANLALVKADTAAIKLKSDMIGTNGDGLTALAPAATALSTAVWTNTLATNLATVVTSVATILGKFSGITLLAQWLGAMAGKQTPNSTALTEINATGAGSGGYSATTDSLEALRDRGDAAWITGSSSGGTGARSVTITVNDGTTVLQNATVRMSQGAETYAVLTNVSGVAVFALDDATWTVGITKAGYTFTTTTIIVNGTETATYSMTAVTITPSDPGETTGYVTIRDVAGVDVSGATVEVEITRWANGTTGSGITPRMRSRTTNASGYAEFTGLPRLATYRVRVNDGEWTSSAVTLDASTTPLTAPIGPVE